MSKGKLYRSCARVEFLASKPEIEEMLDKGYSIQMIFDVLKEHKKISVSYTQFFRYVTGKTAQKTVINAGVSGQPTAVAAHVTPKGAQDPQSGKSESNPLPAKAQGPKVLDLKTGLVTDFGTSLIDDFQRNNFNRTEEE